MNFDNFWNATPHVVDKAIALTLVSVGLGCGFAIGRSSKFEFSRQGVLIEQQAIATQKDLEQSLLIIKVQDEIIKRYEADTEDFSRRYQAGAELAESARFAAEVIPEQQIEELEERVQQSRVVLEENL